MRSTVHLEFTNPSPVVGESVQGSSPENGEWISRSQANETKLFATVPDSVRSLEVHFKNHSTVSMRTAELRDWLIQNRLRLPKLPLKQIDLQVIRKSRLKRIPRQLANAKEQGPPTFES